MATDPYIKKEPGDIIRAGDWNDMQSRAGDDIRERIRGHAHTGDADGKRIQRAAIEPNAIDGSLIDPAADIRVRSLTTTGALTVDKRAILDEIDGLLARVSRLDSDRLKPTYGTVTVTRTMSFQGDLLVDGSLALGASSPEAKLHVINSAQEASGNTLILGPLATSHLRLGYHDNYSWIQSGGGKPLVINPLGNNVGIGTDSPQATLTVKGEFIRKVSMVTGLGPGDDTWDGQIVSRVLTIAKYYADTALRILYCDNLRVKGHDVAARWEIRINGKEVPGGAIFQDLFDFDGYYHAPATILGYAKGIGVGTHTIGVWVGPIPPRRVGDSYTGWSGSRWTLEAQEVWL